MSAQNPRKGVSAPVTSRYRWSDYVADQQYRESEARRLAAERAVLWPNRMRPVWPDDAPTEAIQIVYTSDSARTIYDDDAASESERGFATSIVRLLVAAGGARMLVLPITGLANLAIARLVTKAVGVEQFGVVMLVATLVQLLMFADLGTGAAVATARAKVNQSGVTDHYEEFRGTTLTAIRTTLMSGLVLACGAVLLGALGVWPSILGVSDDHLSSSVNLSSVLALSAFSVALPFAVGEAVLRGAGRVHEAILFQGVSAPGALVLTIIFGQLNVSPIAYALVLPLGALMAAVCCALRAWTVDRSAVTGVIRRVFRPRRFRGLPIARTAVPMFIVMIGLPIALQSDRIVLAHRLDAHSLANYSYAAQLYTPLWSVISVAALALWPHFAAGTNAAALRKGWLTGMAILGGAGVVVALCFLIFSPFVIDWMSDGQATPAWSMLIAFALLLIVQSIHVTSGILLITPRQLRFQAICVIALVLTNLPLSWVVAPHLGASGPVFASVVTVLICQLIPSSIMAWRETRTQPSRMREAVSV